MENRTLGNYQLNIAITTNPYQGLKRNESQIQIECAPIAITTNPYQGLKRRTPFLPTIVPYCNYHKPLSGIETRGF